MKVKDMSFDLMKFISLIRERKAIYAFNDKDNHNRLVVDSLWSEIADKMQRSVIECKTKWHQLRNNYARELRREKIHNKKSIWYLKEPLNFLRNHIIQTKIKKSFNSDESNQYNNLKSNSLKIEKLEMTSDNGANEVEEETIEETITYDEEYTTYQNDSDGCKEVVTIPYDQNSIVNDPLTAQHYNNTHESNTEDNGKMDGKDEFVTVTEKQEEIDADLIFFKSLFPDMNKLTSRRKRKFKETVLISLNRLLDEEEEETKCFRVTYEAVQQQQ